MGLKYVFGMSLTGVTNFFASRPAITYSCLIFLLKQQTYVRTTKGYYIDVFYNNALLNFRWWCGDDYGAWVNIIQELDVVVHICACIGALENSRKL